MLLAAMITGFLDASVSSHQYSLDPITQAPEVACCIMKHNARCVLLCQHGAWIHSFNKYLLTFVPIWDNLTHCQLMKKAKH